MKEGLRMKLQSVVGVLLISGLIGAFQLFADVKGDVDALTGGVHTRIVWGAGGSPSFLPTSTALRGFDSETGQIITLYSGSVIKGVLCAGGQKVAFTAGDGNVYVVDWGEGNTPALIANNGSVGDAWKDPSDGSEWVVYRSGSSAVVRTNIDNTSETVTLVNKAEGYGNAGNNGYTWAQISEDGTKIASYWPFGGATAGLLDVGTGAGSYVIDGCWSSMTCDNSYIWSSFIGNHTGINLWQGNTNKGVTNVLAGNPCGGAMVYFPRFADGPQGSHFFCETAGYPSYNNWVSSTDLVFLKFNDGYSGVAGFARITNTSGEPDQHGAAWVGVGAGGSAGPGLSLKASSSSVPLDETVTLTAKVTGEDAGDVSWSATGGTLSNKSNSGAEFSSSDEGKFTITATLGDIEKSVEVTVYDPDNIPPVNLKIDCGDGHAEGWEDDDAYVSGGGDHFENVTFATEGVENAAPAALYQTCRHESPTYEIPVSNGEYNFRLHFAEPNWEANRTMNVAVEGETILSEWNPRASAGTYHKAYVEKGSTTVADGSLTIKLDAGSSNYDSFIMGIEVWNSVGTAVQPASNGSQPNSQMPLLNVSRQAFSVHSKGHHTIGIYSLNGAQVAKFSGTGAQVYQLAPFGISAGTYLLRADFQGHVVSRTLQIQGN